MTDTDPPADLGEIVVRGQRRPPDEPQRAFNGRFVTFEGEQDQQYDPHDDQGGTGFDRCSTPETALDWNADAAAAEAARAFARLAGQRNPPEDLNTREWGAYLYQSVDGTVRIGPINWGDPFRMTGVGGVDLVADGPPDTIVGFVHSHASGNHLPSDGTAAEPGDIQVLNRIIAEIGRADVRMYIVAANQGPSGHVTYNQINIYNQRNARSSRDNFKPGPQVNPEALPCG